MFTGLVVGMGKVVRIEECGPGKRFFIDVDRYVPDATLGESVAINGCCLTAIAIQDSVLAFEAGTETLKRTNLGRLVPGDLVNLEPSLRLGDRLGGHLVTGHIDAVGKLDELRTEGEWSHLWFRVPPHLTRQMASKGSVAVDGVSLTLVDVEADRFSVALIPHTLQVTTLGKLRVGDEVNLETDVLAKYVERQLQGRDDRPDWLNASTNSQNS